MLVLILSLNANVTTALFKLLTLAISWLHLSLAVAVGNLSKSVAIKPNDFQHYRHFVYLVLC